PSSFLVVERERETLAAIDRAMGGVGRVGCADGVDGRAIGRADVGLRSAGEVADTLARLERSDRSGARVPLTFPSEPWSARTFFNLAPILADADSGANGFVIAVHPDYEELDLGCLLRPEPRTGAAVPSGASPLGASALPLGSGASPCPPSRILPSAALEAVVWSWALLQRWADHRALLSIPFINGGKDSASGQSLACFHAQFYALAADPPPPSYGCSRGWAAAEECPLCALRDVGGFEVTRVGSVGVFAHPAPEIELTLLVASLGHAGGITDLPDPADLAKALALAVRSYEHLLGGVPPYNIVVRTGAGAGHLHAEVMPRAGVPVAAGFEKATGLFVSTRDPRVLAEGLRAWVEGRAPAP
ncbi:MAG TPA: hypothetical protein VFD74_01010, partial [Thermoleophilia bacterium]|nr:hypothetical protein [Thermoleophilia bacterium]